MQVVFDTAELSAILYKLETMDKKIFTIYPKKFPIWSYDIVYFSVLQEAITCMTSSTAACVLHLSMSLGVYAHRLLSSEVALDCVYQSNVCSCGQCTSLILLSLISNQYIQTDEFCR